MADYFGVEWKFYEQCENFRSGMLSINKTIAKYRSDPWEKRKAIDNIKACFAEKIKKGKSSDNENKLVEMTKRFNEIMSLNRLNQLIISYNQGISFIESHLIYMKKAFTYFNGDTTSSSDYEQKKAAQMKAFVEGLNDNIIRTLQGIPDSKGVFPNSKLANEVMRRFGDEKLSTRLRTEPTRWGKGGEKEVIKRMFEERIAELGKENSEVGEYLKRGENVFSSAQASLDNFKKLRDLLVKQQEVYSQMSIDTYLVMMDRLYGLFYLELKAESEQIKLLMKNSDLMKKLSLKTQLFKSGAKELWFNHKEHVFIAMDLFSAGMVCVTPPVGPFIATGGTVIRRSSSISKALFKGFKVVRELEVTESLISNARTLYTAWGELIDGSKNLLSKNSQSPTLSPSSVRY